MDILKILFVFVFIMILLGRKTPLIFVMPAASVLLALLFSVPVLGFLRAYGQSLISGETLEMVVIMYLIMLLEGLMLERGYMQRLLSAMDDMFHSKRMNISLLPMLIGFLPSAGGAMFSAPMVGKAAEGTVLSAEDKTYLNTLYRHIMEIFFPTYPSIILASQLSGIPLGHLIPATFPLAVIVFALGQWQMRRLPRQAPMSKDARGQRALALLISLWPLLTLILMMIAFHIKVYIATAIVLVALILVERIPLRELPRLLQKGTKPRLLLMVWVLMAFKDTLIFCGVTELLPAAIHSLPVPAFLTFSLMALLVGVITGMTVTVIGIVLPLALVGMANPLPITALIILSSYCGVMITPMHLCITMVAEYFQANLRRVISHSLLPYFSLYALAFGLYFLLNL